MFTQNHVTEDQTEAAHKENLHEFSSYPVEMSSFLALPHATLDAAGVPCRVSPAGYDPALIAHYALAHWNRYLTRSEEHTSELQSPDHLVCRLLLEKKNSGTPIHNVAVRVAARGLFTRVTMH